MQSRTKKLLVAGVAGLCVLVSVAGAWIWYASHYVHQHCIVQTGMAFRLYAADHFGRLPYSTNGFGNALLLLAGADPTNDYLGTVANLCGPGDDGHLYREALANHSVLAEEKCSRVYIQGLSDSNEPQICILFDRNSCRGGDHFRSPWGHPLREVCMLDDSMEWVRDEDWPAFSRKQVDLLVAAGLARTNALHFYPAAQ